MKKRIYLSISTIVLSIVLLIGASYAVLSDKEVFEDNVITTGNVEIEASILEGKFDLSNMVSGSESEYTINIDNDSTVELSYRYIFNFTQTSTLLDYLTITINNEVLTFSECDTRNSTNWVEVESGDFSDDITFSVLSSYSSKTNDELKFDFEVQAVQQNFVVVENQEQLNKVVDNEFVILDSQYQSDTVVINKNMYLDLNGLSLDAITIEGDDIKLVELLNGTVKTLDISATKASVYSTLIVTNQINVDVLSLIHKNEFIREISNLDINVVGGKVYTQIPKTINFTVVSSSDAKQVEINWSKETTVSKVVIEDNTKQEINIPNINEANNVEVNNPDANLDVKLDSNENIAYVANSDDFYYTTDENGSYKNYGVTLDDAINSNVKTIYISEGTYLLDANIVINKSIEFIGLNEVIFKKNIKNPFSSNCLISITSGTVLFDNIIFTDHEESDNSSSGIETTLNSNATLVVKNCEFNGFAKNGITVRTTEAQIVNNTFNYGGKEGSAGNAIQADFNSVVNIDNNVFNGFELFDDKWSSTSILLLRGAKANIDNNTFSNNYIGVCVSTCWDTAEYFNTSYTESNNTFNSCDKNFNVEQYIDYIVSLDESTSYVEEVDGVIYTSYARATSSNINDALQKASDNSVIYVLEGEYDVAVYKNDEKFSNLYITKPVSLYAKGKVDLITNLPANSYGEFQQTILINSNNVIVDNFNVHETTHTENGVNTGNKIVEIIGGNNIVVSNCTLHAIVGDGFYIGSVEVGKYAIINNTVLNSVGGITITNGAGNNSLETSVIENNNFSGALFITGIRYNAWNLYDMNNLPVIQNNTFGYYETTDNNNVVCKQFIRIVSINKNKILTDEETQVILENNDFTTTQNIESHTYEVTEWIKLNNDLAHTEGDESIGFDGTTYTKYFGYISN